MRTKLMKALVFGAAMVPFVSMATGTDPQADITAAGTTVAGYAGTAGAAGVLVMVVVWGIKVSSRAIKAAK